MMPNQGLDEKDMEAQATEAHVGEVLEAKADLVSGIEPCVYWHLIFLMRSVETVYIRLKFSVPLPSV